MNYNVLMAKRQMYDSLIYKKVADLERAKVNNEQRAKLVAERDELAELSKSYAEHIRNLDRLSAAIDREDNNFKTRRLDFVNQLITDSLTKLFPQEGLTAKVICDFKRKNGALLQLLNKDGNVVHPDMCSGQLQQYVISFAAVTGIVQGLGIGNVFIDEAFGVAAPEILGDIGKIVEDFVNGGVRVVMIAQQPGLYQDIPHREIQLKKDPITGEISVVSTTDY